MGRPAPSTPIPAAFAALVRAGFVNWADGRKRSLATHDLEAGYLGTALGQDVYTQQAHFNGHYNHIDTINEVRRLGSIQAFVESGQVRNGIMYECVRQQVPFVLVGSVRDDGPCLRCTATSIRDRTPCGRWCGRPPPSSVWPPPSTQWPLET